MKLPKGQKLWETFRDEKGRVMWVITSDPARTVYILYKVYGDDLKKSEKCSKSERIRERGWNEGMRYGNTVLINTTAMQFALVTCLRRMMTKDSDVCFMCPYRYKDHSFDSQCMEHLLSDVVSYIKVHPPERKVIGIRLPEEKKDE